MNEITQLINGVGFPISVCVFIGFYFKNMVDRIMEENKQREEKFFNQLGENNKTMDKFSDILTKIDSRIGLIEGSIKNNGEK